MCGINGFISGTYVEGLVTIVDKMNEQLAYRGPDDGGTANLGWGAIGMRRLSIIDIAHGRQPMFSKDGRYCVVYNGEIYDYKKIRQDLLKNGVEFVTHSDTEVLLNSYARHGLSALGSLNGMFAFAIADNQDRTITLVRDRIGIKPLYYFHANNGDLSFSSELAALVENPAVPRNLDLESLRMFLVDKFIADPWTCFEGIKQLPPGCWLRWSNGTVETGRYWNDELLPSANTEENAYLELDSALSRSIESQLVADVPVGILLSGGIDSSLVAAYAARLSTSQLHTFSMGFADRRYDESSVARDVASHIGSIHHETRVEDKGFDFDILKNIVRHLGQPLADTSCIPMMYLCDFTAEHAKVVLSGDGGDEYFGGYEHIQWAAKVRRASRLPLPYIRSLLSGFLAGGAANPLTYMLGPDCIRRVRKGLAMSRVPPASQLRQVMALWQPEEAEKILPASKKSLREAHETLFTEFEGHSDEEIIMRLLAHTYLPGAILAKVDRMSMAASLEVRVPLLDNRITDFAARLPLSLKIRAGTGKYLLRKAGMPLLPDDLFRLPKRGFSIPLARWFNDEFWDVLHTMYAPGSGLHDLFDESMLNATFADGMQSINSTSDLSSSSAATRTWALALLGCWVEQFDVSV